MSVTLKMMIVQHGNKSLIVRNVSGDPLDLSSAGDIVRGNASEPSNGQLLYLFTSAIQVSVNGETSVTVTTDGLTYNSDVGGKGVDIIFKSGRASGDTLKVDVLDSVTGNEDTYLYAARSTFNYGGCSIIKVGGLGVNRRRVLIRLNIPSGSVQRFINIKDSNIWVYGSKTISATAKTFELYEILPANEDWIPGNRCDSTAELQPSWRAKVDTPSGPANRTLWAGAAGCSVSGVDYDADRLASVSVSGTTDKWHNYADDSGRLNSFIERMFTPGITNPGMVSQISSDENHFFEYFSSTFGEDLTVVPKMVFVYEETDVEVIRRAKKGLGGFLSLTLGDIARIAKSEIPALSNITEVYRSANRVLGRINSLFPGVMETELAFTRKLANTTENLTFELSPTTGAEALTNGGFTGSADNWSLGSGWTYSNNEIVVSSGDTIGLTQVAGDQQTVIVIGKTYEVTFRISNYSAGTVVPRVGSTGIGTSRSANGTFTESIVAAGTTSFLMFGGTGGNIFSGTIDSISCTLDETPPPEPDKIVTTTDLSASALPGRVAYIFGTANNDGLYYIGSVSTVTITLVGVSKLVAEGPVSATIAIYDVQVHEILPETNTILTHTTSTMTDSGLNDFQRMGTKEGDIVILVGSARNNGAYSVASSNGLEITLQSDESLTAIGPSYGRIRIIRPSLAYQFDSENNELKLPDYVKEIVKVFQNDEELTPRSFEFVNNSNNSSALVFNTRERSKIRFPWGIGNAVDDEIHVKVKKDIIEFLYADSISAIEIPALMEEVIIAGTLSLILAKPKYRDDISFKFNNDIYVKGLKEMVDLEIEYEPPAVIERDYDYFPEAT